MSDISEKMKRLRERRKTAPKAPKKVIKKEVENESLVLPNDDGFPTGLLVSVFLFIFFGAKYGIKRT